MELLWKVALVSMGSALGGLARWGVSVAFASWSSAFPWGTLLINLSGAFFLGWFATILDERFLPQEGRWLRADDLKLLLAIGFTGAYTTFSTYEYETHKLLEDAASWSAMTYLVGSMFLGLLAVRGGVLLARLH